MAKRVVTATTVFLTIIVVALVTTAVLLVRFARVDPVRTALERNDTARVLLTIHDDGEPLLTAVLFVNGETERGAVLDIPTNTGGVIPSLGRVDAVGTVFDPQDSNTFRAEVERLIGVEVPYELDFSLEQLVGFIDLLGGLELFIINDYRRLDDAEPVLLPSGNVRLDGDKAVQYLTIVDEAESEADRIGRRQAFVQSLLRAIQQNAAFLGHPDVVPVRDSVVRANLSGRGLSTLLGAIGAIDTERLVRRRVQGTLRAVDVAGQSRQLLFPHFEGQWLKQSVQQIEQSLALSDSEAWDATAISLEVLNGTAATGLARRTSDLMEGFGFDVIRFGNADSDSIEHTLVIDRRGLIDVAERVAQVISAPRVVTEFDPASDVDVTLVLGRDFDGTFVRTQSEP